MDELLQALKDVKSGGAIRTAYGYVADALSCGLDVCKRYFDGVGDGAALLKRASETLTCTSPEWVVGKSARSAEFNLLLPQGIKAPPNTLMVLHPIISTTKRDRDQDILETAGASVAERNPLLWQHISTVPIGVRLATLEHSDSLLKYCSVLLDLNTLTEDCAKLIEANALGISHGFNARKWSRLPGPDGNAPGKGEHFGFHVTEFETMEHSVVSVESNTDAVITLYSRGKLHSDLAKHWAKNKSDKRPTAVSFPRQIGAGRGAELTQKQGDMEVTVKVEDIADLKTAKDIAEGKADDCGCKTKAPDKFNAKQYGSRYWVAGSWEWIEGALSCSLSEHLRGKKDCCDCYYSQIIGTFDGYGIICLMTSKGEEYYRLAWTMGDDGPEWTGEPTAVNVEVTVGDMADASEYANASIDVTPKTAVRYQATAASKASTYNPDEAVRRMREWAGVDKADATAWRKYARGFARVTGEGNKLEDFSFPHHDVEDGKLTVSQAATATALRAIKHNQFNDFDSEAERAAVYAHLAKHSRDAFDLSADELNKTVADWPDREALFVWGGKDVAELAHKAKAATTEAVKPKAEERPTEQSFRIGKQQVTSWAVGASEAELKDAAKFISATLDAIDSERRGNVYRALAKK